MFRETRMIQFADLITISLIALILFVILGALRHRSAKTPYRRSHIYTAWPRRKEFRVLGITSLDEIERFIDHCGHTYGTEMTQYDPEPDEYMWLLENTQGAVELHYDDHEGARMRSSTGKNKRLFDWIARDMPQKRFFF